MSPLTSTAAVDNYVFLLGRPPVGEFLAFIRTMAVDGHAIDQGSLSQEWRAANQHLAGLEKTEIGIADHPPTPSIAPAIKPLADRVLTDPMFQKTYSYVPTEIGMVELDRLVVFQKFINLEFVSTLKASLPSVPSDEDVARMAFAIDQEVAPVQFRQAGQNQYSFVTPSTDFRVLEGGLLDPSQISGFATSGRPFAFLVLGVGFGSNYLNVLSIENRLVLHNGSHRAYALRELGITHAPCVIQRVANRDELELVAAGDLVQNPDRYLKVARPAILKDYFDAALRKVVRVPRKNRLVQVQAAFGQSDVPAA